VRVNVAVITCDRCSRIEQQPLGEADSHLETYAHGHLVVTRSQLVSLGGDPQPIPSERHYDFCRECLGELLLWIKGSDKPVRG
jgi:hypothetical protein